MCGAIVSTLHYVSQDERYIASEHMDVRRDCVNFARCLFDARTRRSGATHGRGVAVAVFPESPEIRYYANSATPTKHQSVSNQIFRYSIVFSVVLWYNTYT